MSLIKVIKASAGSGKTFRLALEYLKLLFIHDIRYYQHILAVTFTNKATAEMKFRILDELYNLAYDKPSAYLPYIQKDLNLPEEEIRVKANTILSYILHNYSRFKVETIDKFFLSVFREFTRELGLPGGNEIELDEKYVLDEAINKLFKDIEHNAQLRNWVLDYLDIKLAEGKSSDINKELMDLSHEIFKEAFKRHADELTVCISDKTFLNDYSDRLFGIIRDFENKLATAGKTALDLIEQHHFSIGDFFQKERGPAGYFKKLSTGQIEKPNSYVLQVISDTEKWAPKSSERKEEIILLAEKNLIPVLHRIISTIDDEYRRYCTAQAVVKNLHVLGILTDIETNVNTVLYGYNRFILANISTFINKIIGDNETPFVFEKFGNRFYNFMIDEFQDTSESQWDNFKPLIENSVAGGNVNLLVGDVKQSIYRWRNSNWEILSAQLNNTYDKNILNTEVLDTNRRSKENIVKFNNELFTSLSGFLDVYLKSISDQDITSRISIKDFYKDCIQIPSVNDIKKQGFVQCDFYSDHDDAGKHISENLISQIDMLISKGYKAKDIAILVRRKDDGEKVTEYLIRELPKTQFATNTGVISNETLYLRNSSLIGFIIAVLRYALNKDDDINTVFLINEFENYILNPEKEEIDNISGKESNPEKRFNVLYEESFHELINRIQTVSVYEAIEIIVRNFQLNNNPNEIPYLIAFYDVVFEFLKEGQATIAGFLEFWETKGLDKTLNISEEHDAVQVLTVHKAKGLEFKAVLIPYCNWSFEPHRDTVLWCKPGNAPFSGLPLVPVKYSVNLTETDFVQDYYTEQMKSYIDNINLLYVAFTRAKEVLIISGLLPKKKEKGHIGIILTDIIPELDIQFRSDIDEYRQHYEFGEILLHEKGGITGETHHEVSCYSYQTYNKLKIARTLSEISDNEQGIVTTGLGRGRIMHMIMENILTVDDIPGAVEKACSEGLISVDDRMDVMEFIKDKISLPETSGWFDSDVKVLNERDFVLPDGSIKRPDRIVQKEGTLIIIDYKFGEKKTATHKKQVEEYVTLLRQMKKHVDEGIIWYVDLDEFVTVN